MVDLIKFTSEGTSHKHEWIPKNGYSIFKVQIFLPLWVHEFDRIENLE